MEKRGRLRSRLFGGLAALLGVTLGFSGLIWLIPAGRTPESSRVPERKTEAPLPRAVDGYGLLPLYFIGNQGQVDAPVKFYAPGSGHTIFFTQEGPVFSFRRAGGGAQIPGPETSFAPGKNRPGLLHQEAAPPAVVRLTPLDMQEKVEIEGLEPQEYKVHYFLGNDPEKWRADVPTYKSVLYKEAYPGIDLKFYGAAGQMEYDVVVKAGADPNLVRFKPAGVESMEITPQGNLVLKLPGGGELVQKRPLVYQEIAGQKVAREGKFRLHQGTARVSYGFEIAAYDKTLPLVIDPVLLYSTYLGGNDRDQGESVAVDEAGCAYVAGWTLSADFPLRDASQPARAGSYDAFVTKLNPAGNALLYSTYLGGLDADYGMAIAVDASQNVYVTGYTYSDNFPTLNALQSSRAGDADVFVTRLDADGALAYSTYLGGKGADEGYGIKADNSGNAYVTGATASPDFWTKNGYQAYRGGYFDAFVSKIDTNASGASSLLYATYLGGGTGVDCGQAIAIDTNGCAYVTGYSNSGDFPTLNPIFPWAGSYDAFVAKIDTLASGASSLLYSTFLGGSDYDYGQAIAVDSDGNAYVAGMTASANFPTKNPYQTYFKGGAFDGFVAKIQPDGRGLVYSTYLGGSDTDRCMGIAPDSSGNVYVVGDTGSKDFPLLNSFQKFRGIRDVFVAKLRFDLSPAKLTLGFSTLLGGSAIDYGYALALMTNGQTNYVYVTGMTTSSNFPVKNPLFPTKGRSSEAYVAKIQDP